MKVKILQELVKSELKEFFKTNKYSLEDELILENEIILSELLDAEDSYEYEGSKGLYYYKDANNVKFFVRLTYQPLSDPYFELKTGWLNSQGKPQYEPSTPPLSPDSSAIDLDKLRTHHGFVALTYAAYCNKPDIVSFLSLRVIDLNHIDPLGHSALSRCILNN